MAIVLFAVSAFFYSYQAVSEGLTLSAGLGSYPYRGYALTFVGFWLSANVSCIYLIFEA